MAQFPGLAHVAVTVSDLSVSVPWYQRLFDSDPVLDEDTGQFHHTVFLLDSGNLFGLHHHSGVSFRDPDNIALEFFCPPG